ncbi:MAG: riboflavin biosynthesis protein RibF [Ruminococcus sp.]|nr:riboflavin biosynthesis protein RibF [Ruminococcus sp.]
MTEITGNDRISEKTFVALGLFDGIHSGHRLILSQTFLDKELAPAVFTFRTESVRFKHGKPLEYICTNASKLEQMDAMGIKYAYSPDFDDVRELSGEEFVRDVLCGKMNAGAVVCGENFRFGKNAACGAEELEAFGKKYGFKVTVVRLSEDAFSSEKYRAMLREGRVDELYCGGNAYILSSQVVHGNRIGRTLDFPTINQHFAEGQLVPEHGVYHTHTLVGGKVYDSVTNVGVKPTVGENIKPLAETHIIGFSGDLYGSFVDVEFCRFIRGEKKFASLEELKKQISADIACVREQAEICR